VAQYLPIFALLVLAIVFSLIGRLSNRLLAPKRPSIPKAAPYESGIVPEHDSPDRFPVKFFLVAMIFIVFDIEIIFLFPFAVIHRELGGFGIAAIVIFSAAVFESFVYLIGNGALDWGPVKRLRGSPVVAPGRTLSGTVRRVGAEGRGEPATDEEVAA
jgi:NADH-quinone oxidoreductase subunit A